METVEAEWHVRRLEGLLRELRRQTAATDPDQLLRWLDRQVGSRVALLGATGEVQAATSGFPHSALEPLGPLLSRLLDGHTATAAVRAEGHHVHAEAVETSGGRGALVVVGDTPLPSAAAALVSHTGSVLTILDGARRAAEMDRNYRLKSRQLRFALLSSLMDGDPVLARRMTIGSVPPLLDAERVRVYLLHCVPRERDDIADGFQDPSGYHGRGLMVQCPAFAEHLICVVPEPAGTEPPDEGLAPLLRRLVREKPRYALGISEPQPLHGTGTAYAQSLHSLAVARNLPARVAGYRGTAPLGDTLPRPEAPAWAHDFLRPLESAKALTLDAARLSVTFPRTLVARLLGVSRNTVAAHLHMVEEALGLDLGDLRDRAALGLALALAPSRRQPDESAPRATLEHLLRSDPAAAWASSFLHPLRDTGHVESTLRAWTAANADARRAAERLGISRNTVRARLRTAERLLNRDLLTSGSGVHDLVLALDITGGTTPAD
ncbi:helix-turn-helix domain-containing protein [Streptomyces sulphureus]|uniref:helix-turn-helix domain-containing protein n=1 Tax=Streptomyces sulphureus TaxID=47758 RepID=UPI0003792E13|nr:helix-turn-helix domain-containing protein [Streptomyces sulphureus]